MRVSALAIASLALAVTATSGCNSGSSSGDTVEKTSALVSTASLQLQVLTNTCGANQAQDFFQVINTGTAAVKLSDIKIKYWVDDTSGQSVVPHVATGGCASGANGSPSCLHQVTGVAVAATAFSPACGPDSSHQANWEITLSASDSATLAPGATWNNIQTSLNLANYSNFTPGTSKWFSGCLPGSSYVSDSHFALYFQGALVFSNGISAPDCRGPHGTQTITSYTPPPAAPVIGPAPSSQVMSLSVALPVTNLAQLQAVADSVSDPNSPSYRKYLNADALASYFPTAATYAQVVSWAQGRGFTHVSTLPNRLAVAVMGTAAQISAAFHANVILAKRPDGTQFYRLDRQPSVDLAVPLLGVSGLDNYFVPVRDNPTSPLGGNYGGSDLRKAYAGGECAGLDGTGQSIGIYDPVGFTVGDIATYRTRAGLPAGPAVRVLSGDDPTNPSPAPIAVTGNYESAEIFLDLEAATAMAPQAQVFAIQGTNPDKMVQLMSNHPEIKQFSTSWEFGTTAITPTTLAVMAAQGQSMFASSGDLGAYLQPGVTTASCSAADLAAGNIKRIGRVPAEIRAAPYVTVVGGTELTTDASQQYLSESAWAGAGGGIVSTQTIPAYQTNVNPKNAEVSTTARNLPDVSLLADNMYIVSTVCTAPGHGGYTGAIDPTTMAPVPAACPAANLQTGTDGAVAGTSVATPLWAGFMALINQQAHTAGLSPVGFANPTFYKIGKDPFRYPMAFNDIVAGTNPDVCGVSYDALVGYDLVTGWGSPRCGMVAEINGAPPSIKVGVSAPAVGGPLICVSGSAFTPNGTVTVQYAGVPELAMSGPQVVTSTQVVKADGTFNAFDNEIQTVAQYVTNGASGCPSSGVVSVNVIDNTTGISATSTIPASLFCQVGLANPYAVSPGCEFPPATKPLTVSVGGIAPELAEYGPVACISGSGFTPNGDVDVEYLNPPLPSYVPRHFSGKADASGKVAISDGATFETSAGDGVACTPAQVSESVTVIVTDKTTGNSASDTMDSALWCSLNYNPVDSGDLSGCGQ